MRISPALRCTAAVALVLASGCEASRFAAAVRDGSVAGYRRFLASVADSPAGPRARAAQRRLDDALYRQCAESRHPLACHRYLADLPHGRSAALARARLAALALDRARTEADLALLIERYPLAREARAAERRLAALVARRALARRDAALCRRFLAWFPAAADARRVRERLAELELARVPLQVGPLERFAAEFPRTAAGAQAAVHIARLLADEIEQTGSGELLEQLAARFPGHPRLPQLRARARAVALRDAILALRLAALERRAADPGSSHPALPGILRHCRRRPRACDETRALAARAAAWRPVEDPETLAQQLNDPDPLQVWRATAKLGRSAAPRAVEHVAALLGSPRIDTVWVAEQALRRWLDRAAPAVRASVLDRLLRRDPHAANRDDLQRHGYLQLLAGRADPGRGLLERVARSSTYAGTSAYLLVRGAAGPPGAPAVARLLTALQTRVRWIAQAFAGVVTAESAAPALLAERELFAITEVLAALPATSEPQAAVARLRGETERALASWRARLRAADPAFLPAQRAELAGEEGAHEAGRASALRALRARRDPASQAVARAICEDRDAAALSAQCGAAGRGAGAAFLLRTTSP